MISLSDLLTIIVTPGGLVVDPEDADALGLQSDIVVALIFREGLSKTRVGSVLALPLELVLLHSSVVLVIAQSTLSDLHASRRNTSIIVLK